MGKAGGTAPPLALVTVGIYNPYEQQPVRTPLILHFHPVAKTTALMEKALPSFPSG